MIEKTITWLSFALSIFSLTLYYASTKKKKMLQYARMSFFLTIICILIQSTLLWFYFIDHRFEYQYIYNHSSRNTPLIFLVTAFWAGQEGSLLFWTLIIALIGFYFQRKCKQQEIEAESMTVYSLLLMFFILMILVKSPFTFIWEIENNHFQEGHIPADGKGISPMLHSIWMVLHPPIIFLGFTLLSIPYVLAVTIALRKRYEAQINLIMPWLLLGTFFLGIGIAFGGIWAYQIGGWGGWWGWDPVENSSLIPWILAVILIHIIALKKRTEKFTLMSLTFAILIYLSIIYSTFLVRSGLLSAISVHAYIKPDSLLRALLILELLVLLSIGLIAILSGRKYFKSKLDWKTLEISDRLTFINVTLMIIISLVIFIGTNAPLIFNISVEPALYGHYLTPLATIMMFIMGIGYICNLTNKEKQSSKVLLKSLTIFIIILISTTLFLTLHTEPTNLFSLFFISTSASTLITIVLRAGKLIARKHIGKATSLIPHFGLALLFVGIVFSEKYQLDSIVYLTKNESLSIFGYNLIYTGLSSSNEGRYISYVIKCSSEIRTHSLKPFIIKTKKNNTIQMSDYLSIWKEDLIVTPIIDTNKTSKSEIKEILIAEIKLKPLMRLVWSGIIIILLGLLVEFYKSRTI